MNNQIGMALQIALPNADVEYLRFFDPFGEGKES